MSDLEVVSEETDGHMWHILYPFVDGPQTITDKDGQSVTLRGLTIATTRPETMLADGALCVHPDDPRYKHLVGKLVELPLCDRNIPIIADDFVDPNSAPAASRSPARFNDYACALRHDLPMIVIFTLDAHINENGPKQFQGMERYEARKAVVAQLEAEQFLVKVEPHKMMQPKGDRTGVVLEPMLTDQWFVAMSKPAPEGTLNPARASPRWRWKSWPTAASSFTPTTGPPSTTSGSTTSRTGASRASCGGATRSPPGTRKTARCSSPTTRPKPSNRPAPPA